MILKYIPLINILLFVITAQLSFAQNKIMNAVRIDRAPVMDGILDDEVWKKAIPSSDFLQQDPAPGSNPSFETVVRILYDDDNLYVGIMCYDDEPEKIIARELRLDGRWSGDDNLAIIFDTFNDKRTGYWFGTNPLGMRNDAMLTASSSFAGFNEEWHGIWHPYAAIVDSGWSVEIIFPFSTFKFHDKEEQIWGIDIERNLQRTGEKMIWSAVGKNVSFFMINFAGELHGINNITRGNPVYLKPFFTGGMQKTDSREKFLYKGGLDIKYGITPTLSLDITFNTDFAQVESDRARINLTRFPLFFPEKREFFLEGASVFSYPIGGNNNLFYSRRIGISSGEEIPIIAGAKLVGRLDKYDLGIINMQTAAKGNEPTTNYTVARVKYDLFSQSYAGVFFSNKQSENGFNRVVGGDAVFTSSEFLGDKTITFGTGVVKSDETNGLPNSWSAKFYIDYPNDLINSFFTYRFIQENFNPGIGFISRRGIQTYIYNLRVTPRVDWGFIRRLRFAPVESQFDLDRNNQLLTADISIRPFGFSTLHGDRVDFYINRSYDFVESPYTIFNNTINTGKYWYNFYSLSISTTPGRTLYGSLQFNTGDFYDGKRNYFYTTATWPVTIHLTLNADYRYNNIRLPSGHFSTNEFGGSIRYDFSTMLYTSLFAQWNNELNELNLNYRFNWQPFLGSNFYLVINHLLSTEEKIRSKDLAILAKLVWFIQFRI